MNEPTNHVLVSGGFDDIRCRDVRFLEEAARLGPLHVLLWNDESLTAATGHAPEFPLAERQYFVQAVHYVHQVHTVHNPADLHALSEERKLPKGGIWAVCEDEAGQAGRDFCERHGLQYRVIPDAELDRLPDAAPPNRVEGVPPPNRGSAAADPGAGPGDARGTGSSGRSKVMVTGCYDWLHTGHIRFFEEVSALGDLYVVVGHDANIRLLKGEDHPLFDERIRRYMVGSIRYVTAALISSGHGWLDAEPEIERIRPETYAVNEDGDKPEKRDYCEEHGIEYVVLKRVPKEGLPRRESTKLRGF